MFAYIEGKIVQKEATFVVIDVGGIGYFLRISLHTSLALPSSGLCKVQTYLHIKEDAHTLYGFIDNTEKKVFLDLMSVSGIGANTALLILSSLSAQEIKTAIVNEDVATIQSIKGIGAKMAQRIVLELKDKIYKENTEISALKTDMTPATNNRKDAIDALVALQIPKNIAERNVDTILKQKGKDLKVEDIIKLALRM
ncbi:MAG: Holliday junction branch migration protein RuvA [Microscillaceae bacterium]|nr:Holliday junction branch migration protein RuvA [Microscillaceae bacterium]MDW8459604.1 Holliday junction branch migration protein RuvA [Cytophagales bacterium]